MTDPGTPAGSHEPTGAGPGGWPGQQPAPGQPSPGHTPPGSPPGSQPGWAPPHTGGPAGWNQPGPDPSAWSGPGQSGWGQPGGWGTPQAPKPGIIPLRPLNFGEILDGAFTTIQRYPRIMLGMSTAVMAVILVVMAAIMALGYADLLTMDSSADLTRIGDSLWIRILSTTFGAVIVMLVGSVLVTGMVTGTVARGVLGQPTTVGQAWAVARAHVLRLCGFLVITFLAAIVAYAVTGGLVFAAAMLHPVAGVVLGVVLVPVEIAAIVVVAIRLSVTTSAIVLETRAESPMPGSQPVPIGIFEAMGRSWKLLKGRGLRTFGILFVANIIAGIIAGILQYGFIFAGGILASVLVSQGGVAAAVIAGAIAGIGIMVASVVQVAFMSAVMVLIYVDARMRSEGLDIELVQATQGQSSAQSVAPAIGSGLTDSNPISPVWAVR